MLARRGQRANRTPHVLQQVTRQVDGVVGKFSKPLLFKQLPNFILGQVFVLQHHVALFVIQGELEPGLWQISVELKRMQPALELTCLWRKAIDRSHN